MHRASPRQFRRGRLRAILMWAMIPLAVVNTRSAFGCIGPDGQFNPNCRCCLAGGGERVASAKKSCCGCACCAHRAGGSSCCCKGKLAKNESKQSDRSGPGAKSNGCRLFVQIAVISAIVNHGQTAQADDHLSQAICTVAIDSLSPIFGLHTNRRVEMDTGPPPDNLVVILQRFVI